MGTPFSVKVKLKLKKVVRDLTESKASRDFRTRLWPSIDKIDGWLYPEEGNWLYLAAKDLPDNSNVVEIGSYKGRSTCCLALGCQGSPKQVFAIDSFDGGPDLPKADSWNEFRSNIDRFYLSDYVTPVVGWSTKVAASWDKPINLLFIDGSHLYEDVMADFAGFFPHVVPGGTVAFHDVGPAFPAVLKAWRETFAPRLVKTGHCESLAFGQKPRE